MKKPHISKPFALIPSTPFALSLWFDKLTIIGKPYHPFALSVSKGIWQRCE